MPLRDDLLEPIAGDNPSGPDLQYDKVFEQIRQARIEEDDSTPAGAWGRAAKRADRPLVVKLAGEMLAKRCKNLELAGLYIESIVRMEGFSQLPGGLKLLMDLQSKFWETVHPALDEDGDSGLRAGKAEAAFGVLAQSVKAIRLTRNGVSWVQYQDARAIGVKTDGMDPDKLAAWTEAEKKELMTGEGLQSSIDGTPKAFYVDTKKELTEALKVLDQLDEFQRERYGAEYPSTLRLKAAIEEVEKVIDSILAEKRKTEPDAPEDTVESEAPETDAFSKYDNPSLEPQESTPSPEAPSQAKPTVAKRRVPAGEPPDVQSAYEQVVVAAEFLRRSDSASPIPYLLCSALRLGETRATDLSESSFAVAPSTETRQALRRLSNEEKWEELSQLCLSTMAGPCGRVWLDLQRYAWRAATETSNSSVGDAIVSTVRAILTDLPELRSTMMDDDTPSANAETIAWIEAHVLPAKAKEPEREPEAEVFVPVAALAEDDAEVDAPDIYEIAFQVLKQGRTAEAINLLVRDSEQQPSGRMRFHRRVQMAQLCLAADRSSVAYPVLVDLSHEMERRGLETWESAEMLAQPLSLLLRCMEKRKGSAEEREAIFSQLCRLDPQAALSMES